MAVTAARKQTDIGEFPSEWDVDRLVQYWNVTDCKHVTASFVPIGYPVASIREVQSRFVDLSDAKQTTAMFYKLLTEGERKPKDGDLILSRNATVGELARVAQWHPPFAMGQDVCMLRKKVPAYSTDFLQSVFRSEIVLHQLEDCMVGSTFKRINVEQIKNLVVPMPSHAEQEAIAESLSDADALIESLEQLLAKKRQIKQGVMQELLTGKRRLPGFDEEWNVKRLEDVALFFSGGTPPTAIPAYYGGDVPWITSGDLNVGYIHEVSGRITKAGLDNSSAKMVEKDTLLIALYGATAGVVAMSRIRAAINQAVLAIIPRSDNAEFLFLKLRLLKSWIINTYTQGGQPNLSGDIVKSIELSLPSLAEQTAIASVLADIDADIAEMEERIAKTRQLKQGLMQELLTGRIRLI